MRHIFDQRSLIDWIMNGSARALIIFATDKYFLRHTFASRRVGSRSITVRFVFIVVHMIGRSTRSLSTLLVSYAGTSDRSAKVRSEALMLDVHILFTGAAFVCANSYECVWRSRSRVLVAEAICSPMFNLSFDHRTRQTLLQCCFLSCVLNAELVCASFSIRNKFYTLTKETNITQKSNNLRRHSERQKTKYRKFDNNKLINISLYTNDASMLAGWVILCSEKVLSKSWC